MASIPAARDAAQGMGMTPLQVLARVEVPLAAPLILAGVRSALLQVFATATIAAYAGLGGLGRFIIDGFAVSDDARVYGGSIVVAGLALLGEGLFVLAQRRCGRRASPPRQRRSLPTVSLSHPQLEESAHEAPPACSPPSRVLALVTAACGRDDDASPPPATIRAHRR